MPRLLSARTDTHRQRADVGWIRLATLTLYRDRYGPAPATLVLYVSDATRYLPLAAGGTREYLPLVRTWGVVGDSLEALNPATAPASVNLDCSNQVPIAAGGLTAARLSDLFRAGANGLGYDPGGGEVQIAWLPPGGVIGTDDVTLYIGRLDAVEPADETTVTIRSTSTEGGAQATLLGALVNPGRSASLLTGMEWINGFEEGVLPPYGTADQSGIWTFVEVFGPTFTDGIEIVPGIHGASRFACRFFTVPGGASGGRLTKVFGGNVVVINNWPYLIYGRMYVAPSVASNDDTYQLWTLYPGGQVSLHWLANGKYRLSWNVGAGGHADSASVMTAGDRLEWIIGGNLCILFIYSGDTLSPRETLTVGRNDGIMDFSITQGFMFTGITAPGKTGAHIIDDVALAYPAAIGANWSAHPEAAITFGMLGPGCVLLATPTRDVSTVWSPGGGGNFALVDDFPYGALDDTGFVSTSTLGAIDRYGWQIWGDPGVGARFYRITGMWRAATAGGPSVMRPRLWTDKGVAIIGYDWPINTAGFGNPAAKDYLMCNAWGRDYSALSQWNIGVEYRSPGATGKVSLLYANLEYRGA